MRLLNYLGLVILNFTLLIAISNVKLNDAINSMVNGKVQIETSVSQVELSTPDESTVALASELELADAI